jgi:hypothetical protein
MLDIVADEENHVVASDGFGERTQEVRHEGLRIELADAHLKIVWFVSTTEGARAAGESEDTSFVVLIEQELT